MKIRSWLNQNKLPLIIVLFSTVSLLCVFFYRVAISDETIYLRDTLIIYEALKSGENPFQYNVGLHGVFFKIPVALLYFITGPSILVATSTNILLGTISLVLFYQILKKHLFPNPWSYFPVALLAFSYRFYGAGTTFLREMPALFSFLLFLYLLLERKSKLLIGFSLLLILDAKEHVFFTTAPPYALILLIENLQKKEKKLSSKILDLIKEGFIVFLPSLTYIVLMFTTNIIPVNMFIASILGLVDKNLRFIQASFSINQGTANLIKTETTQTVKTMPQIQKTNGPVFMFIRNIINIVLSYLGKILYPRSLSFLSVPKIIAIPAIAMSYKKLKETWRNKKQRTFFYLTILLWFYLVIYILRASHGRYLFTISPIFFVYFVLFLKEGIKNNKFALLTTAITGLFIVGGLYFEHNYILIKAGINTILFSWLLILISTKELAEKQGLKLQGSMISIICIFTLGTSFISSLTIGQLYRHRNWGEHMEAKKIMSVFDKEEKIWINDIKWSQLPVFFRGDIGHIHWGRYELKNFLPGKYITKKPDLFTYTFDWNNIETFKYRVKEEEITKVVLVTSETEDFNMQDKFRILQETSWLTLQSSEQMKNKTVHIFDLIEEKQ